VFCTFKENKNHKIRPEPSFLEEQERFNHMLKLASKSFVTLKEEMPESFDILGTARVFKIHCAYRLFPVNFSLTFNEEVSKDPEDPECLRVYVHSSLKIKSELTDFQFFTENFDVYYQNESAMTVFYVTIYIPCNRRVRIFYKFKGKIPITSENVMKYFQRNHRSPKQHTDSRQRLFSAISAPVSPRRSPNLQRELEMEADNDFGLFQTQIPFLGSNEQSAPKQKPMTAFVQMNKKDIRRYQEEKKDRLFLFLEQLEERTLMAKEKKKKMLQEKKENNFSMLKRQKIIKAFVFPFNQSLQLKICCFILILGLHDKRKEKSEAKSTF
jgi:hypothetical protein